MFCMGGRWQRAQRPHLWRQEPLCDDEGAELRNPALREVQRAQAHAPGHQCVAKLQHTAVAESRVFAQHEVGQGRREGRGHPRAGAEESDKRTSVGGIQPRVLQHQFLQVRRARTLPQARGEVGQAGVAKVPVAGQVERGDGGTVKGAVVGEQAAVEWGQVCAGSVHHVERVEVAGETAAADDVGAAAEQAEAAEGATHG